MRIAKDICLIMNDNSYTGREYISALQRNNIFVDIILIGVNNSLCLPSSTNLNNTDLGEVIKALEK
jgi:hypothetical protein